MVKIKVYGAEIRCASCVNAPSSIETASWLEAALGRIYEDVSIEYVDIFNPNAEEDQQFSQRIFDEDLWYPVVVLDGNIITEGTPDLKIINQKLDSMGLKRKE